MDDLISRAAAIRAALRWYVNPDGGVFNAIKANIKSNLEQVPAVDAAPVVHGEWKTDGDVMWCSVCKMPVAKTRITGATGRTHFIHIKTKYCSNCGARNMEELKWGT